MALKLTKLPDRTPVKLTIALEPELHARLLAYARLYEDAYGAGAKVEDLAPVMVQRFIDSDRYFCRATNNRSKPAKGD